MVAEAEANFHEGLRTLDFSRELVFSYGRIRWN